MDDASLDYTGKIDVFSLGIVIAEILTDGMGGDDIRMEGTAPHPTEKLKWIFDSECIRSCLLEFVLFFFFRTFYCNIFFLYF